MGLLDDLTRLALRLDERQSEHLADRSRDLAAKLDPFKGATVALLSAQVDAILVALAAAEAVDCGLLLSRSSALPEEDASAWSIAATIGPGLQVSKLTNQPRGSPGFRVLISTSGTTGRPKVASHSLEALLGRVRMRQGELSARWLLTYHPATFGGLQVLLTALKGGAELAALTHATAATLAEEALAFGPTHASATPTFWRAFLMALGERAESIPIRQITLGGETADQAILDRLRKLWPEAGLSHIYASTESGALFAVRDGRAGFPAAWLEAGVDGVSLRVRGGALEVRSPRAMLGYHGPSPVAAITDGWLMTGDLVEVAGDRVYFRGRADTTLSVGGAKVRPEEVEELLLTLDGVAEACVYGVANPLSGFVLGADVVPTDMHSADELRARLLYELRSHLEPHKVPRILRFTSELSASASGKKERRR